MPLGETLKEAIRRCLVKRFGRLTPRAARSKRAPGFAVAHRESPLSFADLHFQVSLGPRGPFFQPRNPIQGLLAVQGDLPQLLIPAAASHAP